MYQCEDTWCNVIGTSVESRCFGQCARSGDMIRPFVKARDDRTRELLPAQSSQASVHHSLNIRPPSFAIQGSSHTSWICSSPLYRDLLLLRAMSNNARGQPRRSAAKVKTGCKTCRYVVHRAIKKRYSIAFRLI
jgi:hypothetical protein